MCIISYPHNKNLNDQAYTHTHTHKHIYIYISEQEKQFKFTRINMGLMLWKISYGAIINILGIRIIFVTNLQTVFCITAK